MNIQSLEDKVNNLRVQVNEQQATITKQASQLALLNRTVQTLPQAGAPGIHNYVRNGDYSHSFDTYFRAAPVADDARFECWDVYTHAAPSVGQQLKEDSVYSGVLVGVSTALPDTGRSDTPTVDPWWSRTPGYAMMGSTRTIDFPLPSNVGYPGRIFSCMLIAAKRSVNVGVPGRFYAGIWDNTAGQRDFLNGDGFPIEAEVVGIPATTVSREYLIVLTSDSGKTVKSSTFTVAAAPTDAAFISGQVYVRITWPRFAGYIQADIYRKTAGVYVLLSRQSVVAQYFDQGDIQQSVGNYPDTSDTQQKAVVYSPAGVFDSFPVNGVDPAWKQYIITMQIPPTYAQSNTTDKQWLRIGFDQALTGTDAAHGMLLDMVGLSPTAGSWAHNAEDDKGLQQFIAAPSGSSQGGAGTGGGGFVPPDPGGGGVRCIAEDSELMTSGASLLASEVEPSKCLLSPERSQFLDVSVESVTRSWAERTVIVTSESGHKLRCSPTEPFKRYLGDRTGAPVSAFQVGDSVIVCDGKQEVVSRIATLEDAPGCWVIMISLHGRRKFFVAKSADSAPGGFVLHNVKPEEQFA